MAERIRLREFQEHLSARLASARRGDAARSLLGFESGCARWLANLPDAGEVVPLPPISAVPLAKPWFAGVTNIRGTLYSVVDFSAFRDGEPTPRNADARLLLAGARHGINSALLVERTLGLRNLDAMAAEPPATDGPAWIGDSCTDADGRVWLRLDVAALLEDPAFLDVGLANSGRE